MKIQNNNKFHCKALNPNKIERSCSRRKTWIPWTREQIRQRRQFMGKAGSVCGSCLQLYANKIFVPWYILSQYFNKTYSLLGRPLKKLHLQFIFHPLLLKEMYSVHKMPHISICNVGSVSANFWRPFPKRPQRSIYSCHFVELLRLRLRGQLWFFSMAWVGIVIESR